eukprot:TRINITY_DN5358_c0_g1_i1.p1 TRINITY_DN5358_c0_g1~~TRINITY_DN5358_c0_g1_i1.p1  ORF type:complete len:613 (+),score=73.47 TRINITY_DN5358_c0_g1_i1:1026-2864(+)
MSSTATRDFKRCLASVRASCEASKFSRCGLRRISTRPRCAFSKPPSKRAKSVPSKLSSNARMAPCPAAESRLRPWLPLAVVYSSSPKSKKPRVCQEARVTFSASPTMRPYSAKSSKVSMWACLCGAVNSKIFESLDVGMLVWGREQQGLRRRYRCLAINNKCDAYGVASKAKSVVGQYFDEMNPELVDSGLLTTYDAILDAGKPRHIGLVPLQHKDYKPALFNVTGFPISPTLLGVIFEQVDGKTSIKPDVPYYPTSHQQNVNKSRTGTISTSTPISSPASPNPSLELPPLLPSKPESPSRKRQRPDSPMNFEDNERTLPPLDRALQFSSNFVSTETRVHRDAFDSHPLACALLSPSGSFAQANSTFCQLLGYRKDELVGASLTDTVIPPEESHSISSALVQLLNSGASASRFNLRTYTHKQGKTALCLETMWVVRGNAAQSPASSPPSSPVSGPQVPLPSSAADVYIMMLIQPVAGLKERFPAQFGERIFLKSFGASPVAAGIFGKEGRLQEINPALCALLCYSNPRELEGRGFEAFIHGDDLETVSGLPFQMVKSGLPSSQVIVRCKRRDGSTLFCLMYLSLINDELTGLTTHLVAHIQSMSALEQLFAY